MSPNRSAISPQVRDLLTSGIFISKNPEDRVRELETALPLAIQADSILKQARKEKRSLSENEQKIVDSAEALRNRIIQVWLRDVVDSE